MNVPQIRSWFARSCRAFGLCVLAALGSAAWAGKGSGNVDLEILVQLRAGADIAPLLVKHRLSLTGRFGMRQIFRVQVVGRANVKDTIDALRREPQVASAEVNQQHEAPEPTKNVAWAIGDAADYQTQWGLEAIRLAAAHRVSRGAGVRIAVLDTGVDRSHPALAGRLLPGYDFVDDDADPSEVGSMLNRSYGHGTHVAGLLALVAPEAKIMPLRILDADGFGNAWVLAEAMLHAADPDGNPNTDDGAHVINLSIGTLAKTELFKTVARLVSCRKRGEADADSASDDDSSGGTDKTRCQGFGGAVVVAAAGNQGSDKIRVYPAGEDSDALLSVGASERNGWLAPFSNRGWVKLAAPGVGLTSTVPGGAYATWSGTSMAAPLAAGAVALVRAKERSLAVDGVIKRLRDRGARLCDTSLRQLDIAAALAANPPQSSKPSCAAGPAAGPSAGPP